MFGESCGCRFFFSSRRRHTRYWRDRSSDVCSSDLFSSGHKGASIKCNFCPKTIEAPLWPDEKPPGWDLTPAPKARRVTLSEMGAARDALKRTNGRSEERRVGKKASTRRGRSQHGTI